MLYFLYGQDTYRSRAKLKEIVAEYTKKHAGALDLRWFDAETDDPAVLSEFLKSQSLFQKKKLIIIERPTRGEKEFISKWNAGMKLWGDDKDIVMVLWDDAAEKDTKAFLKIVEQKAKTQEYKTMTPREAETWLAKYTAEAKLNLNPAKVRELAQLFHANTWQLAKEAEKVSLGGQAGEPLDAPRERIFGFLDAALIDARGALLALTRLRREGEDDYGIFASLVSHVRTLLFLSGGDAPSSMHPFVVKKGRDKLRRINEATLKSVYQKLFEEDAKTKIGVSDPYSSIVQILLTFSIS